MAAHAQEEAEIERARQAQREAQVEAAKERDRLAREQAAGGESDEEDDTDMMSELFA